MSFYFWGRSGHLFPAIWKGKSEIWKYPVVRQSNVTETTPLSLSNENAMSKDKRERMKRTTSPMQEPKPLAYVQSRKCWTFRGCASILCRQMSARRVCRKTIFYRIWPISDSHLLKTFKSYSLYLLEWECSSVGEHTTEARAVGGSIPSTPILVSKKV